MKGVAHISFAGGGLIVAAPSGYARELLVEHLHVCLLRHTPVHVALDSRS
ncbi:MAG: hypothetical protein HY699_24225 [Deltaproteobacteria bacterium]|nr:hypothetical protein [Deltaproteobacteria bacterium]